MTDDLKKLLGNIIDAEKSIDNSQRGALALNIPADLFAPAAKALKGAGWRLAAEWAVDESPFGRGYGVMAAYNKESDYLIIKIALPKGEAAFPTLTRKYTAAYRFERQINSLMGLVPAGHPDLRPWIKHEDWPQDAYPLRKTFDPEKDLGRVEGSYKWIRAEGEGIFEVPVGPVHAGVIEPGHFRFQSVGEDIINLETRFGYVHKGIEKRFESLGWFEAPRLAGRVSGDTTVAHAVAFCRALEAASMCVAPKRAQWIRAILLERERIANHLGDIGAICNDTAFTFMLYQMAILREKVLKNNFKIFGHRLTMDRVVPGGVNVDITKEAVKTMEDELQGLANEFERLIRIYEDNSSLEDRVYGTGVLTPETAKEIGAVGFVGRSSGQRCDARVQSPWPPYDEIPPNPPFLTSGDVHARTWVRIEEVRDSIRLIRGMLDTLPEGFIRVDCPAPLPGTSGFSVVEGWRGEIIHWVQAGPDGGINRVMVRDPSSVNWLSIEQAIKGNIVPDFPLCNKSFNQSYSGHDL
ncbi:MAG: NADH-quinone oxidoreductase subunit C [Deltaproteobacteria bacterium]|nr:NADH-quinone oxidoreductase subunit C [Deltaproteobacteria bacterium]